MANFFDGGVFRLILEVVGSASMIAATFPAPKTGRILQTIRGILDVLAFNFGHATNAPPEDDGGLV